MTCALCVEQDVFCGDDGKLVVNTLLGCFICDKDNSDTSGRAGERLFVSEEEHRSYNKLLGEYVGGCVSTPLQNTEHPWPQIPKRDCINYDVDAQKS